jgi:HPt (histidine-containing phosphotransfer) domain-containing protein
MDDPVILDRERLTLITQGNSVLADEFLEALLVEADELLEHLNVLTGGDDRVAVSDIGHTLKGMAMELGALRLRAAAAALEAETDPAQWSERLRHITAALAELRLHLQTRANP